MEKEEYTEGEKVLAYHQNLIYEAKILKLDKRPDPNPAKAGELIPFYLIHYQNWKTRWDEWVDGTRIMKMNEDTLKLQQQVREDLTRQAAKNANTKNTEVVKNLKSSSSSTTEKAEKKTTKTSGKRKKHDEEKAERKSATVSNETSTYDLDFELPFELQKRLFEDWDYINHQKYLMDLPRTPSVATVLNDYQQSITRRESKSENKGEKQGEKQFNEIIEGIRTYFDRAIGVLLLYRFERAQYGEYIKIHPDRPLSTVYGPEHLLRLLVKLPELMSQIKLEEEAKDAIKQHIKGLLVYLGRNHSALFLNNVYEPANAMYIKLAEQ